MVQEEQSTGRTPGLQGEVGDYKKWDKFFSQVSDNQLIEPEWQDIVCRDDSGKTRDIKGKIVFYQDNFAKNPDKFAIIDSSSGQAHRYVYEKVAVDNNGNPIYKFTEIYKIQSNLDNYNSNKEQSLANMSNMVEIYKQRANELIVKAEKREIKNYKENN